MAKEILYKQIYLFLMISHPLNCKTSPKLNTKPGRKKGKVIFCFPLSVRKCFGKFPSAVGKLKVFFKYAFLD